MRSAGDECYKVLQVDRAPCVQPFPPRSCSPHNPYRPLLFEPPPAHSSHCSTSCARPHAPTCLQRPRPPSSPSPLPSTAGPAEPVLPAGVGARAAALHAGRPPEAKDGGGQGAGLAGRAGLLRVWQAQAAASPVANDRVILQLDHGILRLRKHCALAAGSMNVWPTPPAGAHGAGGAAVRGPGGGAGAHAHRVCHQQVSAACAGGCGRALRRNQALVLARCVASM